MSTFKKQHLTKVTHHRAIAELGGKARSLFLYIPAPKCNDEYAKLIKDIDPEIKAATPTADNIIIFGLPDAVKSFKEFLTSQTSNELKDNDYLFFDLKLIIIARLENSWEINGINVIDVDNFIKCLISDYIEAVFWIPKVVLRSSSAHHFCLPSNVHSNIFIRLANGLTDSILTDSVAFWLLDKIPPNTLEILVDSPSILPIGYALARLNAKIHKSDALLDVVSFNSYSGLNNIEYLGTNIFVIISASTGGGLSSKLVELGFDEKLIVTILSISQSSSGAALCGPVSAEHSNVPKCEIYDKDSCQICLKGSSPIHILDEHFLFDRPSLTANNIVHADAPDWLHAFMTKWARNNHFRAHVKTTGQDAPYTLYVDVSGMISAELNAETSEISRLFNASVPARLDRIIHLEDMGSVKLAERAKSHYERQIGKEFTSLIPVSKLRDCSIIEQGSALIVAACATTGRDILDISRVLRDVHPNGFSSYLVYFVRPHDLADWKETESSLTYGASGPNQNTLQVRYKYQFPRVFRFNLWVREQRVLSEILEKTSDALDEKERSYITNRLEYLRKSSSTGMSDELFMPSVNGQQLKIRTDYVFFDTNNDQDNVSQGDVFASIAILLHNWRKKYRVSGKLGLSPHQRTVINPKAFDRFNDGIIHAALLRASAASEFDYSWDAELSEEMTHIICGFVEATQNDHNLTRGQRAEALPEFILALRNEIISLSPEHLVRVKEKLNIGKWPPHISALLKGW